MKTFKVNGLNWLTAWKFVHKKVGFFNIVRILKIIDISWFTAWKFRKGEMQVDLLHEKENIKKYEVFKCTEIFKVAVFPY